MRIEPVSLALALVHRLELVILDEHVNGLDPAGVAEVRQLLRGLADGGVTVFMSTHIISEVARLADRVGIIHAGRLIEEHFLRITGLLRHLDLRAGVLRRHDALPTGPAGLKPRSTA